ncbi:MAG: hypothetical protein KY397_07220 [Gemmatimonadetes bacterium]|nr:hypothetical protein [Gemmatimonadota bacterium]
MGNGSEKLERLLAVQEIDMEIVELEKRREELPARRAEVAGEITALETERETATEELERNRLERRHRESEAETARGKLAKYERQLNEVKTNVAYSALLSEIRGTKEEISGLDDEILDRMERIETLERRIEEVDGALEEKREAARDELEAIDAQAVEVDRRLTDVRARRETKAAEVDRRLYELYDRLRRKRRFPALVPLKGQACSACFARMPPQVVQEIKHGGALHPCEHCGVLVYAEPSERAQPADVGS